MSGYEPGADTPRRRLRSISGRHARRAALAVFCAVLIAAGATGVTQYARTYWLYRGFPPPSLPSSVKVTRGGHTKEVTVVPGTEEVIDISSPSIAGRTEPAYVYLPPGYFQHPTERYPVFYILHGSPGGPINFLRVIPMGYIEDLLVAEHLMRPMILVGPTGNPSFFSDTEWADSPRPGNDWATYLARDVVGTIDRMYRTIPNGADRIIGGLSEGGYGALNIAFQHPGEFRVVESWSGYMTADGSILEAWGVRPSAALLARNSPAVEARRVADELVRDRTFIWFYCGSGDPLAGQNRSFAAELSALGIPHEFEILRGGHSWVLWRQMARGALLAASEHVANG